MPRRSARQLSRATLSVCLGIGLTACGSTASTEHPPGRRTEAPAELGDALGALGEATGGPAPSSDLSVDLDRDPVRVRAQGVGNTPEQARARAFENARVEAANIRSVQINSERTLAERTDSLHTSGGFDATNSSSSLTARSRQSAAAVLRGVAPTLLDARQLGSGVHVATAEIAVPREQLVPQRVLNEMLRESASLSELEAFRLRAMQREDWDAAAQVEQALLASDPSVERVLDLSLSQERRGRLSLALQVLDRALDSQPDEGGRLRARRRALALKLAPVQRELDTLVAALSASRATELALRADREELAFNRVIGFRGPVPADHDLLLFWVDQVQLTSWGSYPAGAWIGEEYSIDDPADWRPGRVRALVFSGPGLSAVWDPDLDIDLAACERGDLAERDAFEDALTLLRELAASPGVITQVLSWNHLERTP